VCYRTEQSRNPAKIHSKFICNKFQLVYLIIIWQGDSLFWDTRTKTADLPLAPEGPPEEPAALPPAEAADHLLEEGGPKEGRELKRARRRLTAAMRNFTVADFTPDRWDRGGGPNGGIEGPHGGIEGPNGGIEGPNASLPYTRSPSPQAGEL
jgi:hypothetical protein